MSRHLRTADLFFILSAIPILLLLLLGPGTFESSRPSEGKLGTDGFLFVFFFLGLELIDFKKTPSAR